jgi:polyisoprenoid-binding protein YceI
VTGVIQRSDFGMTTHRISVRNPVRFDLQIHWATP